MENGLKLIVFGSTGSIGRELVNQALEQKRSVTAFARNPQKLEAASSDLQAFQGDVLDYEAVRKAVEGHDVVLVTLGAGRKGGVRAEGTQNIIRAMEATGVRRLIVQSTLGVGSSNGNLNFFWKRIMFGAFLKEAFADHVQQEAYVKESDLDWTIVRPGAFTDGPHTGQYRHGFSGADRSVTLKISRADVADFLLNQVESDTYSRKAVGLSY